MRESEIVKHLYKQLHARGGEYRRVKWLGRNGAPDLRIMLPQLGGWWIETKATNGDVEIHQAKEHERMRNLGERVLVLDSIERIDEFFAEIDRHGAASNSIRRG